MGRSRTNGVDCVGLGIMGAADLGWDLPDTLEPYPRVPEDDRLIREFDARANRVVDWQPADFLVFYVDARKRLPAHVGVFTERGGLVHAWLDVKRVVEWTDLGNWRKRVIAAYRLRECS